MQILRCSPIMEEAKMLDKIRYRIKGWEEPSEVPVRYTVAVRLDEDERYLGYYDLRPRILAVFQAREEAQWLRSPARSVLVRGVFQDPWPEVFEVTVF